MFHSNAIIGLLGSKRMKQIIVIVKIFYWPAKASECVSEREREREIERSTQGQSGLLQYTYRCYSE